MTESRERKKLAINRPMRASPGTSNRWLINAKSEHGDCTWVDVHGEAHVIPCACIGCIRVDYPELSVGEPAATESCTVEELKARGLVGLYQPLPMYSKPCPLCGEVIDFDADVDESSEVVHVKCLNERERELLCNVGYNSPYITRRKRDELDRTVVSEQRDYKYPARGGLRESREPVQGIGREARSLVGDEKESEGPDQRSK